MPIAKLLRTVFGLGGSESDSTDSTTVTVERDPETTDEQLDEDEVAVESASSVESEPEPVAEEEAGDGAADDTATDAAEEGLDDAADEGLDEAAEETLDDEVESDDDGSADVVETPEANSAIEDDGIDGVAVENVSGIGPAYAERLAEAGVETVEELIQADPDELAVQIDVSAKRIGRWQDSAGDL